MKLSAFFLGLMLALMCGPASAQTQSICDQQTEPPGGAAELEAVLAACAADLAAKPGDTEATFRYALALERAGRVEDALRVYQWAAEDGYAPALEAVLRLTGADPAPEADWSTQRAELGKSMAGIGVAIRRFENDLPPDPSDPLSIIAEIGTDPMAIMAWMSTHTRLVPYAGSLRGPRGVLADRSGNSLDRALALASLLTAAGEDVRLARSTLDEAQAMALLESTYADQSQRPDFSVPSAEELLATLRQAGVSEDLAKSTIQQNLQAQQRIDAKVAEQMAVLLPLLGDASKDSAANTNAALEGQLIEQLKDHFWVQAKQGEHWIDFDPDAAAAGRPTPSEFLDPAAIPDQLRHAITVRAVIEIQAPTGRREETLVSWTGYAGDGTGDRLVTLSHMSDAFEGMKQLVSTEASSEQFLAALNAASTFTPLIWVDGQVIVDKVFTRDGQIRTADPNVLTQVGRENVDAFDQAEDLLGSDGDGTPPELGFPTAEWIEVELVGPGEAPRVERRSLFDLLGPAARAANLTTATGPDQLGDIALSLIGYSDILILGANPSRSQFAKSTLKAVAEVADSLEGLALQTDPPDLNAVPKSPQLGWPLRQLAQERLAGSDAPAIVAPNVFMYHQRLNRAGDAGAHGSATIDIVFNDTLIPKAMLDGRIRQGISDSILEGALLEGSSNTASDTVADLATGKSWTLVKPGEEYSLAALDADLRTRIETDLSLGRSALVPPGGSSPGWWRIYPEGNVLAMQASGGGSAMVEEGVLTYNVIMGGVCLAAIGSAIGGGSAVAAGAVCMAAGGAGGVVAGVAVASGAATAAGVIPAVLVAFAIGGLGFGSATGGAVAGQW